MVTKSKQAYQERTMTNFQCSSPGRVPVFTDNKAMKINCIVIHIYQIYSLFKLPYFDALYLHSSIIPLPCRVPLILGIPELLRPVAVLIIPGFRVASITYPIREESIRPTNSHINNEVKLKCRKKWPYNFFAQQKFTPSFEWEVGIEIWVKNWQLNTFPVSHHVLYFKPSVLLNY